MNENKQMLEGMAPQEALGLFSDNSDTYRITWHCGRAEAAQRQRRAGVGEVTDEGYVRETPGDFLAAMANEDPDASVEVVN